MLDYRELLKVAYEEAAKSPDPSTQNGAILVNNDGEIYARDCNRFPRDHNDREGNRFAETSERLYDRGIKYKVVVHAEESVLWKAAQNNIVTSGLTMVCPWAACFMCARSIIEFGIRKLVVHADAHIHGARLVGDRKAWNETIELANQMLAEANVERIAISGKLGAVPVLCAEKTWRP